MPDITSDARTNALHWAAIARGLYLTQTINDIALSADDEAAYARYSDNAHQYGITDAEIDEYLHVRLGK